MDGIGRKHKNIDGKHEKPHLGSKKHPNLPLFPYDFPWGRGAPKLMATCHAKTYAPDCSLPSFPFASQLKIPKSLLRLIHFPIEV